VPRWPNTKLCGANKTDGSGETCKHPAGWRTDHPGIGQCRLHGGSTQNAKKNAESVKATEYVRTFGLPRDISPTRAILEEVHRTAGHVAWLGDVVATLKEADVVRGVKRVRTTPDGKKITDLEAAVSMWVKLYQEERKHLVQVCKAASDIGFNEMELRLAQRQGELLAGVIQAILGDLFLTDKQQELVPIVVPRHLQKVATLSASSTQEG
jgi:hypothetical protein